MEKIRKLIRETFFCFSSFEPIFEYGARAAGGDRLFGPAILC